MGLALTYIINHVALLANPNPKNPMLPLYIYNGKSIPSHISMSEIVPNYKDRHPAPLSEHQFQLDVRFSKKQGSPTGRAGPPGPEK